MPLLFRTLEPIQVALLTQLLLDAFCRQLQVVSDLPLEDKLHSLVCSGELDLKTAQAAKQDPDFFILARTMEALILIESTANQRRGRDTYHVRKGDLSGRD